MSIELNGYPQEVLFNDAVGGLAGKNIILNGGFDFWTRGTTSTVAGYIADRWYHNASASTTFAKETTIVAPRSATSFKMTAGATATMYIQQAIETNKLTLISGQAVTISAHISGSVATPMSVKLFYSLTANNPVTGTWTAITAAVGGSGTSGVSPNFSRISGTFIVPATALSLLYQVTTTSTVASGVIIYIGNCQIEQGNTASAFTRSAGDINLEVVEAGSAAQDGVLVSTGASSGPNGSGTNSWAGYNVAGKNAIINGGMDVWQRNTSFSVPSAFQTYAADRFQVFNAGANEALTVARQATNDTTNLPFIQYCTRVQRNSGQTGTTLTQYGQTLESINSIPFAGKTITFSFYARAGANFSAASNLLGYSVQSGTGTDQNLFSGFTGATNVINAIATLTTTWQRFTYSGTVAATATQLGVQFAYTPTGTAGTNDYYEVTGVQLELGSTATTFSRSGGSINGEETAVGSAAQDGILYSQNASSNPSGSGSNAWAGYGVAGKNAVINGGMDIWQRGTSIAIASNSVGYSADRMYITAQLNSASTVSRQATADTTNLPNIQYCARVQRNAGQTGTGNAISQSMETINSIPFAGKQVTLSFYARAGANYSPTANALSVVLYSGTGTEQNINGGFTGQATPIATSATLTTTWQRFSFTGTIATTATELAFYFSANSTGTAGANDYFEITGVQLELGSTATTFSRAGGSIGVELALCQRYYYQIGGTTFALQDFGNGHYYSLGAAYILTTFPVPMRVAPTTACLNPTSFSVYSAGTGRAVTTFTISSSSPFNATALFATAAATAGNGCWLEATNANATLTYSAEL